MKLKQIKPEINEYLKKRPGDIERYPIFKKLNHCIIKIRKLKTCGACLHGPNGFNDCELFKIATNFYETEIKNYEIPLHF